MITHSLSCILGHIRIHNKQQVNCNADNQLCCTGCTIPFHQMVVVCWLFGSPRQWNQILHKDPSVKAYVILISNNVDEAERIKATLAPGRAHICAETTSLAITFKQIFRDSMLLSKSIHCCIVLPIIIFLYPYRFPLGFLGGQRPVEKAFFF